MNNIFDNKKFQLGTPGEVIRTNRSVCLTPFSGKTLRLLDLEVIDFANEHGIVITDEDSYQYACHIFDKVYDAGCQEG